MQSVVAIIILFIIYLILYYFFDLPIEYYILFVLFLYMFNYVKIIEIEKQTKSLSETKLVSYKNSTTFPFSYYKQY